MREVYVCLRSGGGVHPVLPQTHERHRGYTLQHELHQQQSGNTHRRTLQPQRGRRHQGQKRQVQKVTRWEGISLIHVMKFIQTESMIRGHSYTFDSHLVNVCLWQHKKAKAA